MRLRLLLLLVLAWISVANLGANDPETTEVVVLGTLHGIHKQNPEYSPAELRRVLLALKPAAILTESPDSFVDEHGRIPESVYASDPDDAVESPIENEVADSLGIRLHPFDRPDRQEHFARTRHSEREQAAGELFMRWYQGMESGDSTSVDLQVVRAGFVLDRALEELTRSGSARMINSSVYDDMVRALKILQHEVLPTIFERQTGYEEVASYLRFDREQWLERNHIMASRIAEVSRSFLGQRILVVTGGRHRYILRDLLAEEPDIVLREYWEIAD